MTPLSNIEIEKILGSFNFFRGVFAKNVLPCRMRKNEFGVINNENINGPYGGTHWVCYFNTPTQKYIEFFDSFGLPPAEEIETYLKSSSKNIEFNSSQIQDKNASSCGYFCLYFLFHKLKGILFQDILNDFLTRKNLKQNDYILLNNLKNFR